MDSRPPAALYHSSYAKEAQGLCARGAGESDLANYFKCTVWDIRLWCAVHRDFSSAVKVGEAAADDKVTMALYQRATGFSYDEVKVTTVPGRGPDDKPREARTVTTKWVAGDPGAAQFWLKNRRPDLWTDKVSVDHTVNADIRDIPTQDLLRIAAGGGAGGAQSNQGKVKSDRIH